MGDASTGAAVQRARTTRGRPVSLLFVSTVGSTLRFLLPYATYFRALGWRVSAAASGATLDAELLSAFDDVHELALSRSLLDVRGLLRGSYALRRILATEPDIVHVHTPIAGFLSRLVVHQMPAERRPAVAYTAHGFHFYKGGAWATNALFLTAERTAGRWTDRLIVINDEDEAAAERHRIVPHRRLVRMPGIGLDTGVWSRASIPQDCAARVRAQAGIASDAPILLVVGELNRNKRQGDAISALAAMRNRAPVLVLAGDGPEKPRLERLASELGVRDRVRFLGFVPDVRPLLCAATILILPSEREGLARSVMEALALEVPVITSQARGNGELVGSDRGILVDTGHVRELAKAMDWLGDHGDERLAMGQRGRERMVEHYDITVLLARHEAVYREMLAERRVRAD